MNEMRSFKKTSVGVIAVLGMLVSAPATVSAWPLAPFPFNPQMFSWAGPEPETPLHFLTTGGEAPRFAAGRRESRNPREYASLVAARGLSPVRELASAVPAIARDSAKAQSGDSSPTVTASKSVKLSGYTQIQFSRPEVGNDTFSVRRTRLSLTGEAARGINFKVQADLVRSPILIDANADFGLSETLNLRVGQFQVPFSMENLTSSSNLDTINRSRPEEILTPGRDNKAQGRDIGVMLFGSSGILEYALGVFNGPGINQKDVDDHKDLAARLVIRPAGFLQIGTSYYDGKRAPSPGRGLVDRDRLGFECAVTHGGLSLKGEHISAWDGDVRRNGWYVQGIYDVLPGKAQAVLKYDLLDSEGGLSGMSTALWTAGINVFLPGKTKLQVNYEYYRGENGKRADSAVLAFLQAGF